MALNEIYADLHIHSYYSDGSYSPKQIVKAASQAGLEIISICDHDNIYGIKEAIEEGKKEWVEIIPSIEISTRHMGKEIHIIGYYIDIDDPVLIGFVNRTLNTRKNRIQRILGKLVEIGIKIKSEDIFGENSSKISFGRLHIARALITKGYVSNIFEAFNKFIGDDSPYYEPHLCISAPEVINMLVKNGAIPVLAHPGGDFPEENIKELISYGLKGIEVFYPTYTPKDTAKCIEIADKYGLLKTGGSDFHYSEGNIEIGMIKIEYKYVERLKKAAKRG